MLASRHTDTTKRAPGSTARTAMRAFLSARVPGHRAHYAPPPFCTFPKAAYQDRLSLELIIF